MTIGQLGLIISLTFPAVISIYKETRFVKKSNVLAYGFTLVVFALSYTEIVLPKEFDYLKLYAWAFLISGLLLLYLSFTNKIGSGIKSLLFSWKNFGAFEFAFVSPVFFKEEIPAIFIVSAEPILNLGLNLLVLFWFISGAISIYRTHFKDTDD